MIEPLSPSLRRVFTFCAVLSLAGCSRGPAEPRIATLSAPNASANSGASIAASGNHVVVAWAAVIGEDTNIFTAASDDGGATFRAPVRVNNVEGDARVSGEQAPRVAIGKDIVV